MPCLRGEPYRATGLGVGCSPACLFLNELLGNDGITNVYQRKHEWVRRCSALKRKQDNVTEMEQLIERESE